MPATSKIVLGTVQFGLNYGINNDAGKPSQEVVNAILSEAWKSNIRTLDTAEAYGTSHESIGKYHQTNTNKFEVISKYHTSRTDLPDNIQERVLKNISILGVDHLYGYMFHSFNDYKNLKDKLLPEFTLLKHKGIIKKIGVSIYTNDELQEVLNDTKIDLIQLPFNLLDNFSLRGELLSLAKTKNKEIHTRSVFLQGLFFMDPEELPTKIKPLRPYLNSIHRLSNNIKLPINQLALNYVLNQSTIDRVLIGVDTVEQLKNNIQLVGSKIDAEFFDQINSIEVKEKELLNPANWN